VKAECKALMRGLMMTSVKDLISVPPRWKVLLLAADKTEGEQKYSSPRFTLYGG